jgi:CheY-like chemotaxis protein
MHEKTVYALTPLGEQQLRGARTTVSVAEVELLVRVDGVLTLGEIRAGMTPPPPDVDLLVAGLLGKGLVQVQMDDPFADQLAFKPSRLALEAAAQQADATTASLKKAGYFVRIARARPARTTGDGQLLSALIVEDDPHLAKFLQQYLAFEGFDVRVAGDRAAIVGELRKFPVPDLVLLDVMLPDTDGFDILYKMRQHPALREVPVIMLTGKATREAVIKGLAGGADGYVTKPFEADALVEAVRTVMGLPGDPQAPGPGDDPWPIKA